MRIVVPKESKPGERRVAATPKTVEQLRALGYDVAPMEEGSEGRLARSVEQAKGALVQALAEGRLSDEQAAATRATLRNLLDP